MKKSGRTGQKRVPSINRPACIRCPAIVKNYDQVRKVGVATLWALRIWNFDLSYRHAGVQLVTAAQIGIYLAAVPAQKGT